MSRRASAQGAPLSAPITSHKGALSLSLSLSVFLPLSLSVSLSPSLARSLARSFSLLLSGLRAAHDAAGDVGPEQLPLSRLPLFHYHHNLDGRVRRLCKFVCVHACAMQRALCTLLLYFGSC